MDFSDRCMGMLPYAQAVAAKYGAELILLHVENDERTGEGRQRADFKTSTCGVCYMMAIRQTPLSDL